MPQPKITLIGLPTDRNSSFERGPARAPDHIREALWSPRGNLACENGMEIGRDITIKDIGNITMSETTDDHDAIRKAIADCLDHGAIPLALGGDHSVTFPILEAITAQHGPVNILHIDAHPDLYDDFDNNPFSHASPFARIMEQGLAKRLVQVGIRTLTKHCREQAERFGVEIIEMRHFTTDTVPVLDGPLYISLDLDGIDPAFAPGVSHPEPGGLGVRDVLTVLDRQIAIIVGADIVELNPDRDKGGVTAVLAAKLVREMAALIHRNHK